MSQYEYYRPHITLGTVYDGVFGTGEFAYNHMVSIAFFKGLFYAVWGAHATTNKEGQPGQINVLSTSEDFVDWTAPLDIAGLKLSATPIIEPDEVFWQPELISIEDRELWCFWSYGKEAGTLPGMPGWGDPQRGKGLYLARLSGEDGKWRHEKIMDLVEVDGNHCAPFVSQNPYRCESGRVLVPLTLVHDANKPAGDRDRAAILMYNACAWSDDEGANWHLSNPVSRPDEGYAQWEPCFWEQRDGRIRGIMRNFDSPPDRNLPPVQRQLTVVGGSAETGAPIEFPDEPSYACLETGRTRTQVFRLEDGRRWCMLGNDAFTPQGARNQLALYFSRTGEMDFVAGPMYNRRHEYSTYSQGFSHDGRIYTAWTTTENRHSRWRIESAVIDPAPTGESFHIWSREKSNEGENYTYAPPPSEVEIDGRRSLHFRMRGSAGVEIEPPDYQAGQSLVLSMAIKITRLQQTGSLVLCSFGDRFPIRVGIPSRRPGRLYVYGRSDWQPLDNRAAESLPLNEWHTIEIRFGADTHTIQVDTGAEGEFLNPVAQPVPRLYLGDGFEVDRVLSNDGSEFYVDIDSVSTHIE